MNVRDQLLAAASPAMFAAAPEDALHGYVQLFLRAIRVSVPAPIAAV